MSRGELSDLKMGDRLRYSPGVTTESSISESDLWSALEEAIPEVVVDDVPAANFTAVEFAKRYGISANHARHKLGEWVEAGKLCMGRGRRKDYRSPVNVYWVKK